MGVCTMVKLQIVFLQITLILNFSVNFYKQSSKHPCDVIFESFQKKLSQPEIDAELVSLASRAWEWCVTFAADPTWMCKLLNATHFDIAKFLKTLLHVGLQLNDTKHETSNKF
jgi:hypothetical protein